MTRKQVFDKMKWVKISDLRDKLLIRETHKTLMTGYPIKKFKYMTEGRSNAMIEDRKIKAFQPGFGRTNATQNIPLVPPHSPKLIQYPK